MGSDDDEAERQRQQRYIELDDAGKFGRCICGCSRCRKDNAHCLKGRGYCDRLGRQERHAMTVDMVKVETIPYDRWKAEEAVRKFDRLEAERERRRSMGRSEPGAAQVGDAPVGNENAGADQQPLPVATGEGEEE